MMKIKEYFKKNKLCFAFVILIVIALITSVLNIKNISFVFVSLAANVFLIYILNIIRKTLKINFSKNEKIFISVVILLMYAFYFISVLNRNFIYYWDYSCYYNLQIALEDSFNINFISGVRSFVGSTWSGEYGNFLSFFPEFIFNFTSKTINAYLLSCVVVFIPYIIVSFGMFIKQLIKLFKIEREKTFFYLSVISLCLFPMLHATFIYGQPDLFGLVFVFLILSLTITYDFKKLDVPRLITLILVTFMLLITRRWYMYFIFSYYVCYAFKLILTNIKDKKSLGIIVKNGVIFVLIMAAFFLITLFPLLKNIIASNFANAYSYYMIGGFPQELINQLGHVGYITFVIMIIGLLYGVINKKYRACTLMFIFEYFITIFMFTRIQNMGLHHSLLLLPAYLYSICMFVLLVIKSKFLLVLTILMFIINFMFGVFYQESKVFTDVKLKVPQQKDYLYIKEVCDWLNDNLDENSRAYMITHNNMYNPDKFRNFYMPDKTISKYLPYGSAILGTHKFPVELFDAKYVITTYPFENVSIENVYNEVFNELVGEGKFKLVKTFDMHNGYSVLIYRRIEKVDYDEVMMYENALEGITKDYSNLYKQVIEVYLNENKLVK